LIENNSIKLNGVYDNELLNVIQTELNEMQQKMFVAFSFCQCNYNKKTDYIIDIGNISKWLGFSEKKDVIDIIQENYRKNDDYIVMYHKVNDNDIEESFLLSMNTFKSFCRITDNTSKTKEINEFFKKLEEVCDILI
jgi:hypothetical protein